MGEKFSIADLSEFTRHHAATMDMMDGSEAGAVTMFLDKTEISKFKQVADCMQFLKDNEETIRTAVAAAKRKPRK